jgi:hypothetical protein
MPDPFELPARGIPARVDLRAWDRKYGDRSPGSRGGTWRMIEAGMLTDRALAASVRPAPHCGTCRCP